MGAADIATIDGFTVCYHSNVMAAMLDAINRRAGGWTKTVKAVKLLYIFSFFSKWSKQLKMFERNAHAQYTYDYGGWDSGVGQWRGCKPRDWINKCVYQSVY